MLSVPPTASAPRLFATVCVALALANRAQGGFIVRETPPVATPGVAATSRALEFEFANSSSDGTPQSTGDGSDTRATHAYAVSLRRRNDLGYFCSGALIGRRHVLTAAHCVDASQASNDAKPVVVIGSRSSVKTSGDGVQLNPTIAVHLHPSYPSQQFPNLAILELAFDATPTPIQLPTVFLPKVNDTLAAIGWGGRSGSSELMRIDNLKFIPRRICGWRTLRFIFARQICVGGDGLNSCEGDDGGLLVLFGRGRQEDILVGVMGAEHVCGITNTPDVHTNIFPYMEWIASFVGVP